MQTSGDRIWFRVLSAMKEYIAEREGEIGFTGGYLDAAHISGGASSGLSHSSTGHTAATLGNLMYAAAAGVWSLLAGNTTTTRKFLRQTGTGAVSAAPVWDTLVIGDLPHIAKSILSAGFAIDSIGVKTVTTAHGLSSTPALKDVHLTVDEDSNVDDWGYSLLKVESVDATNVVSKINVSSASATGSATAKLGILIIVNQP